MTGSVPERPTHRRYGVVAFTLSLVALAYLDRVCISTAAPAIKRDLGLDDVQMGLVFSAFTLSYALFEVPSGWFADRFGPRLTIARIVAWWSVMTALTGVAGGFGSLVVLRLLFGMGEAGTFPATTRVYARWLPAEVRGAAFGLAIMAGALGGALTQPLVVALLGVISWRHTFPLFGAVGIAWSVVWWWWYRDDPAQHAGVNEAELRVIRGGSPSPPEAAGSGEAFTVLGHAGVPWGRLLRSRTLAALCAMYAMAIYGWYFYLTWMPTYLLNARGFDLKRAGYLAALPYVGIAVGVYFGGWVSDRMVRWRGVRTGRCLPGLVGLPLAAAAVVGAVATPDPMQSALLLGAAAGLAAMGVAPAWAVCLEMGGPHAGVVSGAMNMFGNLGGALSPVVVGFGVDRFHSWDAPLLTVAACYVGSALCWLLIHPEQRIAGSDR